MILWESWLAFCYHLTVANEFSQYASWVIVKYSNMLTQCNWNVFYWSLMYGIVRDIFIALYTLLCCFSNVYIWAIHWEWGSERVVSPSIFHPSSILIKGVWGVWGRLYLGTLWEDVNIIYLSRLKRKKVFFGRLLPLVDRNRDFFWVTWNLRSVKGRPRAVYILVLKELNYVGIFVWASLGRDRLTSLLPIMYNVSVNDRID